MEDGDPIRFLGYRGEIKSTPSHYFKGLALCPSLVATSEAHNVNKLTKGSQRIQLHREMRAQMRIQMQIRMLAIKAHRIVGQQLLSSFSTSHGRKKARIL